jgi:hypothetical protein
VSDFDGIKDQPAREYIENTIVVMDHWLARTLFENGVDDLSALEEMGFVQTAAVLAQFIDGRPVADPGDIQFPSREAVSA